MAKRKPLVILEKVNTENGFSMHGLHECTPFPFAHNRYFAYDISCLWQWSEAVRKRGD